MATSGQIGASWLNGKAWRDGETPPEDTSMLHDRGFVLGDGLFETIVVRRGEPVLWEAHLDRMEATAKALFFPLPADLDGQAREATAGLLQMVDDATRQRGTLRITLTRGAGTAFGLDAPAEPRPTLMVRLTPATRHLHTPDTRETAWIVDQPRIDPGNVLSGHKTTSSMWRVMAHEGARAKGADLALMKTIDGDIAEADTACFFAVFDDIVTTPPLSRGILPSTTRGFILAELEAAGRGFEERRIFPDDLESAREVFLSSSVTGIRPLAAVDGRPLPAPAPVSEWLDERYEALP